MIVEVAPRKILIDGRRGLHVGGMARIRRRPIDAKRRDLERLMASHNTVTVPCFAPVSMTGMPFSRKMRAVSSHGAAVADVDIDRRRASQRIAHVSAHDPRLVPGVLEARQHRQRVVGQGDGRSGVRTSWALLTVKTMRR